MADANVPIKFEIYKGDQLVREEVLAQSPIKIGKLGILGPASRRRDRVAHARRHRGDGPGRRSRRRPRLDARDDRQRRARHQGAAAVRRRGHVRRLPA